LKFAVLGDPISHSLSPVMHQAAYDALGLEHSYEAIRVPAGSLRKRLQELRHEGFRGVNITVPLKEEALGVCKADSFALRCGAVNTIDLESGNGINTDGPGFVEVLHQLGFEAGASVLMLGAGGSARAISVALKDAGFNVTLWNRTASRAEDLARLIEVQAIHELTNQNFDIAVNATSASLQGAPIAMPYVSTTTYVDLYYSAEATPFMNAARRVGAPAYDGRDLLVAQGALAFEFWLGFEAPRQAMRSAVGL
jgi:shikimate dehydrogenase